jgi:hypothetical protein
MAKHTPSIPPPQHQPEDDYGGIEAGVSLSIYPLRNLPQKYPRGRRLTRSRCSENYRLRSQRVLYQQILFRPLEAAIPRQNHLRGEILYGSEDSDVHQRVLPNIDATSAKKTVDNRDKRVLPFHQSIGDGKLGWLMQVGMASQPGSQPQNRILSGSGSRSAQRLGEHLAP